MKQEVYRWMENLAVFYILLTCVLHLVPQESYQRYVRFFMGLVLTVMLCTPVFSIFGESRNLFEEFEIQYEQDDLLRQQQEQANLQEIYLMEGYRQELQEICREALEDQGIFPEEIRAVIGEGRVTVILCMAEAPKEGEKRGIDHALGEIFADGEAEWEIQIAADGENAVSGAAASGASAGSGALSGIRQ